MNKEDVQEELKQLRCFGVSMEEVAVRLGKGFVTVWLLSKGKRKASAGDKQIIRQFLDEKKKEKILVDSVL